MNDVQGLPKLLRAVGERLDNNVDGLNKELLLQSAQKLDDLEWVAEVGTRIINAVPKSKSRGRGSVMIRYDLLVELMRSLEAAGKQVKVLRPNPVGAA